ncbi:polysaccharide pyruvyl transferase family protein [Vibrio cyclitrophicus]
MNKKKVVVLNDTKTENHHGCSRVMDNLYYLISKNNGEVIGNSYVSIDWRKNELLKSKIMDSDIVIINGEGTIHHDSPHAIALLDAANYCQQFNKKIYLINALFQCMSDDLNWKLKLFDGIYVRDSFSQKELSDKGIKSEVIYDLTFYSNSLDIPIGDRIFNDTYTCSVILERTIKLFEKSKKCNSVFSPIMFGKSSWVSPNNTLWSKIKSNGFKSSFYKSINIVKSKIFYRKINIYSKVYTHDLYHRDIANTKFLVSGRFHSVCFAINSMTPFVALRSNSHKVEALLEDFELSKDRIVDDLDHINTNLRSFSPSERDSIHEKLIKNRYKTEEVFKSIFS